MKINRNYHFMLGLIGWLFLLSACSLLPNESNKNQPSASQNNNQSQGFAASSKDLSTLVKTAKEELNDFWRVNLDSYRNINGPIPYNSDNITHIESGCPLSLENAFYCANDNTIYYDVDFLNKLLAENGAFVPVVIMAHEWGHAIQAQVRPGQDDRLTVQKELEADCFAGAYAQASRGLEEGDFEAAIGILHQFGDTLALNSPQAHGDPLQRVGAFTWGKTKGVKICYSLTIGGLEVAMATATPIPPTPTDTWTEWIFGRSTDTPIAVVPTDTLLPTPTVTNTPKPIDTPLPTSTVTNTPKPTATFSPTPTLTNTPKPTATPSPTSTITNTPKPPTATPLPPTSTPTSTPKPPTATSISPTSISTSTPKPPTITPIPPTSTPTSTPKPPTIRSISSTQNSNMVRIPAGEFIMGSTQAEVDVVFQACQKTNNNNCNKAWFENEMPQHTVDLNEYYIDKYEVTNAQYAECVSTGKCILPHETKSYTRSNYYGNTKYDNYPVIYVDWTQAKNYCEFAEKRLPTEAEWEKAARGKEGQVYPWGNESPSCDYLNFGKDNGCVGDTTEVGSYELDKSPYGVMDMGGNVSEWVSNEYKSYSYKNDGWENDDVSNNMAMLSMPIAEDGGGENDDVSSDNYKIFRGGSWYYDTLYIRVPDRDYGKPTIYLSYLGFRCAK